MSSKFVWEERDVEILYAPIVVTKGGAGSGHYGHSGRPGEHGGSLPGKGSGLVVSDTFTGVRCSRAVIMNGKVYEGDEYKGAYHTPTMARMVVAGHIPNSLHMKRAALEIIYDKIPEDSEFESKIMRMTDAYDVQLDNKLLIVDQEKIPRYGENVGVSEGINSLLKKFQRDVKRGIIDPIGCNEIFLSYSTASVRIPFFELDDIAQIIWNDQYETILQYKHIVVVKGGSGSGDFGHEGRPGLVGGSGPGKAFIGAKSLEDYVSMINGFGEAERDPKDYGAEGEKYKYRIVPQDHPDYYLLRGIENEMRNAQRNYGMSFEEYRSISETKLKKELADANVYMRITPENLEEAIIDGNFENTFMSKKTGAALRDNKIKYGTYINHRKEGEETSLGVPRNASPEDHPIYGYWDKGSGLDSSDWEQYGNIAVEFDKGKISDALTFTQSDSLDMHGRLRSSDWRNPSITSCWGLTNGTFIPDTFGKYDKFGGEAQIYSHSIFNIKMVRSKSALPRSLRKILEEKGIPWEVVK